MIAIAAPTTPAPLKLKFRRWRPDTRSIVRITEAERYIRSAESYSDSKFLPGRTTIRDETISISTDVCRNSTHRSPPHPLVLSHGSSGRRRDPAQQACGARLAGGFALRPGDAGIRINPEGRHAV